MARAPYSFTDRELLARIRRSAGEKAGYKQLVRELGLGGGRERRLLLEQLSDLVTRRELQKTGDEMWAISRPAAESSTPSLDAQRLEAAKPAPAGKAAFNGRTPSAMPWREAGSHIQSGRDRLQSGRLELHRDGYGFVRPEAPKGIQRNDRVPAQDIFIAPNALHGAMHGDLVLVEEEPPARDGRRSGRIARVLTRRNPTIVGIFHYAHATGRRRSSFREEDERQAGLRGNYVQPLDERLGGPVEIPEGGEIPPITGESPHRTLGDEAKGRLAQVRNAHESVDSEELQADDEPQGQRAPAAPNGRGAEGSPDPRWPLQGMAVEVEITSYPQPGRPARGRVLEVLGPPDAFGVDVEIIIRKHGIPHTFPTHVLAEADLRAAENVATLPSDELALREDFRDLPIVTIDGETARDFDDAVLVRPLPDGHTELQVHIADIGWYVRAGSALDTEARVRGTSVYFPDRAVPMLPHALSSGMCSLRPHEDRLVLSCIMAIDPRGEITGYRIAEGLIRSARRMTYTSVQHCLNASPEAATWNAANAVTPAASAEDTLERERVGLEQPELPAAVDRMLELALRLNRKRVRRGSIDFDLPEPVVEFDPDGNMKAIVRSERGWAHRLIEEFMLSANECVATWLTAQGIPSIYRIHEMPDPKRILEFEETAAGFGQTLGIGALPVKRLTLKGDRREAQRRSEQGRNSRPAAVHDVPERIPVTPQMYQRLIKRLQGQPEERILAYLMLRSLKQARYAEKNEGHFALASPCYTHFTSPIRRYPDLIVHRLLRTMLRRGAQPRGGALLSTDPQPWAADAAAQAAASRAAERRTATKPALDRAQASHKSEPESPRTKRREGRIGWTTEGATLSSPPNAREDNESRVDEPEFAMAAGAEATVLSDVRGDPLAADELADMAVESSQAERRAAEAERELIEWKKMKFMADRIGDDFHGIILSVTKYGFFVELNELFIEGLVPLGSLTGDFYSFRDGDRTICGARTGHCFKVGDPVDVILDRIDRQQRRLQFALTPGTEPATTAGAGSIRAGKSEAKKIRAAIKQKSKAIVQERNRKVRKGRKK